MLNILTSFNDFLWSYVLIILLISLGLYFSIRTGFIQIRYLKHMFKLLTEGISSSKDKDAKGISSFQAFCISTASRVGTGNLAGVAIAVAIGGPGAVFWMWLIALIGAGSSFVESTLAQIYKVKDGNKYRGGPAYYIEQGLKKRWMGLLFSILITVSFGFAFNSVQSNTIALAFDQAFGIDSIIMAFILAILTSLVIFGGVDRIAKVTEILVPVMAVTYLAIVMIVLVKNASAIPHMFALIIENAFGFKQTVGGGLGGAILLGVKRGLFSNEAGMGSAPNVAAAAEVTHPVKQGLIQTLGVFTDTLLICSATAFLILLSGVYTDGSLNGIQLTQAALSSQIGSFGNIFIAICIFLFAFSSIIGNYYYGETNIEFMNANKIWLLCYRVCVIIMVFVGAIAGLDAVWSLADLFMAFMAIINLIAILQLSKTAFSALKNYVKQRNDGLDPVFSKDDIDGIDDVECW